MTDPMRRAVTLATAAALVGLALAACTGEGSSEADLPEVGPLEVYSQAVDDAALAEGADAWVRTYQEALAACMAEQGFEYTPWDTTMTGEAPSLEELGIELTGREFRAQYGYSMMTDPVSEAGWHPTFAEDPNLAYTMSLSDAERAAWEYAMYGDPPGLEAEAEDDVMPGGCAALAGEQVAAPEPDDFAALREEIGRVLSSAMADERAVEVTEAWAACMVGAGYPHFTDVFGIQDWLVPQVNAFDGSETERIRLQELEIDAALADYDCQQEAGYERTTREVDLEYQQVFVDAHRDELDAWVQAVTEQGSP